MLAVHNAEQKQTIDAIGGKADQIDKLISNLFHATLEELEQLEVKPEELSSQVLAEMITQSDHLKKIKSSSICHKGDVVVSQDYGVAAMALGKGAYAIHQSGKWYTNENIDQMLMERHLNKKVRRSSHKNHMKGPRKRTEDDDVRFGQSFEKLILIAKSKEGAQSGTL